jgi:hypothetical protein
MYFKLILKLYVYIALLFYKYYIFIHFTHSLLKNNFFSSKKPPKILKNRQINQDHYMHASPQLEV